MANVTQIPSSKVPILLGETTDISTEWYRFFFNLYSAVGIGTPYTDGQILIGDGTTGNAVKATLTAGAGVSIVNGPGSITINVGSTPLTPGVYGSASSVSQITVDAQKIISNITSVPIYIDANQINPATFDAANLVTKNTAQTITGTKTFTGGIVSAAYNFTVTGNSIAYNSSTSEVQFAIGGANAGIISTASAKFPGSVLAPAGFNFNNNTSWAYNSGTSQAQLTLNGVNAGIISATSADFPNFITCATVTPYTDNSTKVATTAFVQNVLSGGGGGYASLAGTQTFTGANTFTGGIISTAYNFTSTGNSIAYNGTDTVQIAVGGNDAGQFKSTGAFFVAPVNATNFIGAGTGLTGTASSLSIGGNAATVTNGVYTTGTQTITGAKTFTGGITSTAYNFDVNSSWAYNSGTSEVQLTIGGNNAGVISTSLAAFPAAVSANAFINSTNVTITAGADSQGSYTIASDYNRITTTSANPSGVTLPAITSSTIGRRIVVINAGTNPVNVYPPSSSAIDGGSTNAAVSLAVGYQCTFNAVSTTAWASSFGSGIVSNSFVAGPTIATGLINSPNAINFYNANTGNAFTSIAFGASSSALAAQAFQFNFNNAGAAQLAYSFFGDGTAQKTGGGSWSSISDVRLKDNITPLTGALAKIASLNPVTYSWRHNAVNEPTTGFIAQEVQQVFPSAVSEHEPTEGEKEFVTDQTMSIGWQNDMTAYLVGAIKELKAELESVKAELATFKT